MPQICIIIPCYNEADRLPLAEYEKFIADNPHVNFCFVDDGSIDNTNSLLLRLQKIYPESVMLVKLNTNMGKAEAVRQGILQSLAKKYFDYFGFFDADLATPLAEINTMLIHIELGFQMILGARVKRLGALIKRSLLRHYLGRVFATFASITMNLGVYDSQCGAKIFSKELGEIMFRESFVSKWIFDIEMLIRAKKYLKDEFSDLVYEMPLNCWLAKKNSKIKVSYLLRVPVDLLRIKRKYFP